jgi:hypothetical protein
MKRARKIKRKFRGKKKLKIKSKKRINVKNICRPKVSLDIPELIRFKNF